MQINNISQLGKQIRAKRKSIHLTQVECAGITGVGVRFLSDLESGKVTCEIGKTLKILNALGLHLHLINTNEDDQCK